MEAANDNKKAPEEINKRLKHLSKELGILNDLDDKAEKPLNDLVKKHHADGKLTQEAANQILDLRTTDKDFQKKWDKLKAKLSAEEADKLHKTMQEVERETTKIETDFKKRAKEAAAIMESMVEVMNTQVDQENAIKNISRTVGFPVQPGTKLRYKYIKNIDSKAINDNGSLETWRYATIKAVNFEEIELKDENGKVVKKTPSLSPIIVMDWEQADTKEKGTFNFTEVQFKKNVDIQDICEVVEGLTEESLKEDQRGKNLSLEALLGEKIKAGDVFEYRERTLDMNNRPIGVDKKVRVVSIDEKKQEIMLDTDVVTADYPDLKKEKILSYGNFAKWYRRMEAVKEIHGLKDLREKLKDLQNYRNNILYKDEKTGAPRNGLSYPPIEVKPGEELKYDNVEDPCFFKIKDADDKKITLENGGTYTPSTFFNWVKSHEVEKATPNNGLKPPEAPKKPADENGNGAGTDEEYPEEMFREEIKKAKDSKNFMAKLWDKTMFVTPADMFEVMQRIKKFILGKKGRKIKDRQFKLGRTLAPGMEPLFKLFNNKDGVYKELEADFIADSRNLEKEKVGKVKETLKEYSSFMLKEELYKTISPDWARAILELLSGKGEIRWDDRNMWESLDRVTKGKGGYVYKEMDLEKVIDKQWGEGFFHELRSGNDGKYNKTRGDFMEQAERLAGDPNNTGGLEGACRNLLLKHMRGEYVNPAEYEGYLAYSIKNGKMSVQDKIYFLVMGLGARGQAPEIPGWKFPIDAKSGRVAGDTLLATDRYSKLESEFLATFPLIDYFLTDVPRLKEDGTYFYRINEKTGKKEPVKGPALKGNWIDMVNRISAPDFQQQALQTDADPNKLFESKYNEVFNTWIDRDMVWDEHFRVRLAEKASSNVSRWDHDDFHFFGPIISEGNISQLARYQGGGEQKASIAGLKNTYAGFNNYIKNTFKYLDDAVKENNIESADANSRRMVNLLRSFTRFDSIMSKRFEPNSPNYTRLGDRELSSPPGVDSSRNASEHKGEVNLFMEKLCREIGLGDQWYEITRYVSADDAGELSKRSNRVEEFGPRFEGEIYNYIQKNKLEGLNSLIQRIQSENGKKAIQGILSQPAKKVSKAELEGGKTSLQEFERPDLKAKVQKLRDLQSGKGRKTKAQMAAEDQELLNKVINQIDNNQLAQVSGEGIDLLNKTIQQLEGATDADEGGAVNAAKAAAAAKAKKTSKPAAPAKRRKAA